MTILASGRPMKQPSNRFLQDKKNASGVDIYTYGTITLYSKKLMHSIFLKLKQYINVR